MNDWERSPEWAFDDGRRGPQRLVLPTQPPHPDREPVLARDPQAVGHGLGVHVPDAVLRRRHACRRTSARRPSGRARDSRRSHGPGSARSHTAARSPVGGGMTQRAQANPAHTSAPPTRSGSHEAARPHIARRPTHTTAARSARAPSLPSACPRRSRTRSRPRRRSRGRRTARWRSPGFRGSPRRRRPLSLLPCACSSRASAVQTSVSAARSAATSFSRSRFTPAYAGFEAIFARPASVRARARGSVRIVCTVGPSWQLKRGITAIPWARAYAVIAVASSPLLHQRLRHRPRPLATTFAGDRARARFAFEVRRIHDAHVVRVGFQVGERVGRAGQHERLQRRRALGGHAALGGRPRRSRPSRGGESKRDRARHKQPPRPAVLPVLSVLPVLPVLNSGIPNH